MEVHDFITLILAKLIKFMIWLSPALNSLSIDCSFEYRTEVEIIRRVTFSSATYTNSATVSTTSSAEFFLESGNHPWSGGVELFEKLDFDIIFRHRKQHIALEISGKNLFVRAVIMVCSRPASSLIPNFKCWYLVALSIPAPLLYWDLVSRRCASSWTATIFSKLKFLCFSL